MWVAVLTILAVSLTPPLVAAIDRARRDAGLTALQDIEAAVNTFGTDIGEYPPDLNQLLEPLVNGDQDICGSNYNGGERNQWAGPYIHRPLNAAGLIVPIGTIAPDFVFIDLGFTGYVFVVVGDVDEADALGLDAFVDDNDGANAGTIWWIAGTQGLVDLYYLFQIPPC